MKFALLVHIVSTLDRFVSFEVLHASSSKRDNVNIEKAYRETFRGSTTKMEGTVTRISKGIVQHSEMDVTNTRLRSFSRMNIFRRDGAHLVWDITECALTQLGKLCKRAQMKGVLVRLWKGPFFYFPDVLKFFIAMLRDELKEAGWRVETGLWRLRNRMQDLCWGILVKVGGPQ